MRDTAAFDRAERHAARAERLDSLRRSGVIPLCLPAFIGATSWAILLAASSSGGRTAAPWRVVHAVAVGCTLVSPVFAAVATVLNVISTTHRPFSEVRRAWLIIGAALLCV